MSTIGFACTTIDANASSLIRNVEIWTHSEVGPISIALDRKSKLNDDLSDFCVGFDDPAESAYEKLCPWDSYCRKNISFSRLARTNPDAIFETDDDNVLIHEGDNLKRTLNEAIHAPHVSSSETKSNIFSTIYNSSKSNIWARGYPISWLDGTPTLNRTETPDHTATSPKAEEPSVGVVQFLVDGNPDVDAIYRLVHGELLNLSVARNTLPLTLYQQYHPFNSQATLWPAEFFPLMYLPSTCPFRMTDIWRGYIAQWALYSIGRAILFAEPIVFQERNEHRISADFFGEHEGYVQSEVVIETLAGLPARSDNLDELVRCAYERLITVGIFEKKEAILLDAWLRSIS